MVGKVAYTQTNTDFLLIASDTAAMRFIEIDTIAPALRLRSKPGDLGEELYVPKDGNTVISGRWYIRQNDRVTLWYEVT